MPNTGDSEETKAVTFHVAIHVTLNKDREKCAMDRILPLGLLVGTLLMATDANAQSNGGAQYDWQTGTYTTWSADPDGTTRMRDSNWGYGSSNKTTISPDGSARGTDKGGSRWNHNAQSGYYFDFSTGKSCFQKIGVNTC